MWQTVVICSHKIFIRRDNRARERKSPSSIHSFRVNITRLVSTVVVAEVYSWTISLVRRGCARLANINREFQSSSRGDVEWVANIFSVRKNSSIVFYEVGISIQFHTPSCSNITG